MGTRILRYTVRPNGADAPCMATQLPDVCTRKPLRRFQLPHCPCRSSTLTQRPKTVATPPERQSRFAMADSIEIGFETEFVMEIS
jgi:hypothetical protein